jgi:hypothetical protein
MRHTQRPERVLLLASLAFCLTAPNVGGQQAKPPSGQGTGELKIYDIMTGNGTVASRTFRDSLGRVSKLIYYSAWGSTTVRGPFREQDLRLETRYPFVRCPGAAHKDREHQQRWKAPERPARRIRTGWPTRPHLDDQRRRDQNRRLALWSCARQNHRAAL